MVIAVMATNLLINGHFKCHRCDMKTLIAALVACAVFAASALFAGSTDTNSVADGFYRTIVGTNTEQYAVVDFQKETVTLYDIDDHVVWATNVIMGLQATPVMGARKISGVKVYEGDLWINVGRGYAIVAIKTGSLKCFAQN